MIVHGDLNLVFHLGNQSYSGLVVLFGLFGLTLLTWGVSRWGGSWFHTPGGRALNLLTGGATLGGLGWMVASFLRVTTPRDYLFYRPWGQVQILHSTETHHEVWRSTFEATTQGVPPPVGLTPWVGNTLGETIEFARTAAVEYLARLHAVTPAVTSPTNSNHWFWIGLGVVAGVALVGGLILYFGSPPPPSPPGGPPGPRWWDSAGAESVTPRRGAGITEDTSLVEDLAQLLAPRSPPRPRSPPSFGIEQVESLLAGPRRGSEVPLPRGGPGLTSSAPSVTTGGGGIPPFRVRLPVSRPPRGEPISSSLTSGGDPISEMIRTGLPATAAALSLEALFGGGGRTFFNPESSSLPPTRPAGVFTPLSSLPDLVETSPPAAVDQNDATLEAFLANNPPQDELRLSRFATPEGSDVEDTRLNEEALEQPLSPDKPWGGGRNPWGEISSSEDERLPVGDLLSYFAELERRDAEETSEEEEEEEDEEEEEEEDEDDDHFLSKSRGWSSFDRWFFQGVDLTDYPPVEEESNSTTNDEN